MPYPVSGGIGGGGVLTQAQVDARIAQQVQGFAQAGSSAVVPAAQLPNLRRRFASLTDTRDTPRTRVFPLGTTPSNLSNIQQFTIDAQDNINAWETGASPWNVAGNYIDPTNVRVNEIVTITIGVVAESNDSNLGFIFYVTGYQTSGTLVERRQIFFARNPPTTRSNPQNNPVVLNYRFFSGFFRNDFPSTVDQIRIEFDPIVPSGTANTNRFASWRGNELSLLGAPIYA